MKKLFYFFMLILLISADQIVKALTVLYIDPANPIVVFKNVFELTYVKNTGGPFGILQGTVIILSIITALLLTFVVYCFIKLPNNKRMEPLRIICLLVTAGGIGNLIDRIFRGFVVDTFYFKLINFPVFNVADSYVTIAVFSFIFLYLFYYKESDFECILLHNKKGENIGK